MTQNEKDLLLKDLCARLPYDVKFPNTWPDPITSEPIETIGTISNIDRYGVVSFVWTYEEVEVLQKNDLHIMDIKPYLFPLSSMKEEQKSQYSFFLTRIIDGYDSSLLIDWFNKNHIDYRGLIPMGLANDATGLNIY